MQTWSCCYYYYYDITNTSYFSIPPSNHQSLIECFIILKNKFVVEYTVLLYCRNKIKWVVNAISCRVPLSYYMDSVFCTVPALVALIIHLISPLCSGVCVLVISLLLKFSSVWVSLLDCYWNLPCELLKPAILHLLRVSVAGFQSHS